MAGIPERITAGTTLAFSLALTAYPAPTWSLSLVLRGPQAIDLTSSPENAIHVFAADAATTSAWQAGAYWYSLRATDGVEVIELDNGNLKVSPDLAAVSAEYDGRTHAERTLAAVEEELEIRARKDQDSYRINNREWRRTPLEQLLRLRDRYRQEVRRERAARRGRNTLGRQVLARFGRV